MNNYKNKETLKIHLDNFKKTQKLPQKLLMLAPLAGFSDLPFRYVVKLFGADITVSEMISIHALVHNNEKTKKMTLKNSNENLFALQISGSDEEILKRGIELINNMNWVEIIDFNCGCPAPKVAKNGNGSALLKDLDKFVKILRLIRKYSKKNIFSVKVRLGFETKIPEELSYAINESGVDYCVVHARTKKDGYKKEKIDYESLAIMKKILKIPLIANGEISSLEKYKEVMNLTGADGAMIGREAIKSPWIFHNIKNETNENFAKLELILKHLEKMHDFYGERGIIMFRKNLHAYAMGHKNASSFKNYVNSATNLNELKENIFQFFSTNPRVNIIENAKSSFHREF